MMYYDFETGGKTYKLRLTTRYIVKLEEKIGCNPLTIFGQGDTVPTVDTMMKVFWASLQQLNQGVSEDMTYDIFDSWLDEGHTVADFYQVIFEVYKVSGLIKEEVKN